MTDPINMASVAAALARQATAQTNTLSDELVEGRRMFVLAAATLERDVLLHALTEDEQNVLVGAVLNAGERIRASGIERIQEEARKLRAENERLKIEIAAIMRGELYAPDVAAIAGASTSALEAPTGKSRKFSADMGEDQR